MEESVKNEFLDSLDKITVLGAELKKKKKDIEAWLGNAEKAVKEEGFKLIHAREEFEKTMAKQADSMKSVQDELKIAMDESKRIMAEANATAAAAQEKMNKADQALASAQSRETSATNNLTESQRIKDELQAKLEKAKAMAQALG